MGTRRAWNRGTGVDKYKQDQGLCLSLGAFSAQRRFQSQLKCFGIRGDTFNIFKLGIWYAPAHRDAGSTALSKATEPRLNLRDYIKPVLATVSQVSDYAVVTQP